MSDKQRPDLTTVPIVFIDIETTGLDPRQHAIIELAAIKVKQPDLQAEHFLDVVIRPREDSVFDPAAMEVNKISMSELEKGIKIKEALEALFVICEGAIIGGHNTQFDWNFITYNAELVSLPKPKLATYRLIDTAGISWPLIVKKVLKNNGLQDLCEHFNIDQKGAHRASTDVRMTLEVYKKLVA